ncbi:MAG: GatB/YqeY domain-containing protein, partial [Mariprofundus sp.]|nr:GatB/YqeY domain-containing protein [Mariprofundus sp.]
MLKQLTEDMKTAMKAKDKERLSCIRLMRAALKDKEIEIGHAP